MDTATARESEAAPQTADSAGRLAALRAELARRGLAGFVVPRADEHQGEYVPPRAERLPWLTGFIGSAGLAVVLAETAAIFIDGRYTLQVREQVDTGLFVPRHMSREPATEWIAENLPSGGRLGFDPWLHTADGAARLARACAKAGGTLEPCRSNPLDAVWPDQPELPLAPVAPHPIEFAGRESAAKRRDMAEKLKDQGAVAAVLTLPDSIAWLLNIRGGDVARSPLPLSFAILRDDGSVRLFMDKRKATRELRRHLNPDVALLSPAKFGPALDELGGGGDGAVLADPASAAEWVFHRLKAARATVIRGADPCVLAKACKNPVEIEGARAAHRRDGAALTRFLAWLAREAPKGQVDEIAAAGRLEAFRRENTEFRDLSFDTISAAGANGAIVHYRVSEASNRRLEPGMLYLVDSGAQYPDGTTDVTRTIAIGPPPAEARDRFTRVLRGHIALASARFPADTTGTQLDILARVPLWRAGLDYDHGTGHGVGSYLGVHEGPQRISKLRSKVALLPGMIVSNEPGYYKTGEYGIRIENLVTVVEFEPEAGAEQSMLGFETLTLAPIDRALVDISIMGEAEIAWLDDYHARVREILTPLVDSETADWLAQATEPL